MSWISKLLGTAPADNAMEGEYGQRYKKAVDQYADPNAGQDQLAELIRSQVSSAMPQFNKALGGVRENAIQRGISTGDLGTSYEGDLASSFQNHIANSVAGQSFDLFNNNRNTYLDLVSGGLDRSQDRYNSDANRRGGLFGSVLGAAGSFFGGRR